MSKIYKITFILAITLLIQCNSTDTTENGTTGEDPKLKAAKESVQKMYSPPDCFLTGFDVQLQTPEKTQTADGTVRSDTLNQRMRLMFRVPYIGISLSQMTVVDETVYVKTIQDSQVQTIPLDRFEVRGLGQNSIRLPFTFFQELLYGRLPGELYEKAKWVQKPDGTAEAILTESQNQTRQFEAIYKFRKDSRLASIEFERPGTNEKIRVITDGVYRKEASFPKKIEIISSRGNYTEVLRVIFKSVRLDSNCSAGFFPKSF